MSIQPLHLAFPVSLIISRHVTSDHVQTIGSDSQDKGHMVVHAARHFITCGKRQMLHFELTRIHKPPVLNLNLKTIRQPAGKQCISGNQLLYCLFLLSPTHPFLRFLTWAVRGAVVVCSFIPVHPLSTVHRWYCARSPPVVSILGQLAVYK